MSSSSSSKSRHDGTHGSCADRTVESASLIIVIANRVPKLSETFVTDEIAALQDAGHDVRVYSLRKPNQPGKVRYLVDPVAGWRLIVEAFVGLRLLAAGWPLIPTTFRRSPRALLQALYVVGHASRIRRTIRRSHSERRIVVHAHFLAKPAEVAWLLARTNTAQAAFVTVHASDAFTGRTRTVGEYLSTFDGFRCASGYVRDELAHTVNLHKMSVIRCVASVMRTELETDSVHRPHDPIRITSVGRLVETKGYHEAFDFLTGLTNLGLRVSWEIIGDGPLQPDLKAWTTLWQNSNLTVVLRGGLPHNDVLSAVADCDYFLLMCRPVDYQKRAGGDGLPISIVEAMAYGKPTISTPTGGIPELVRNGRTGYIVDTTDKQYLTPEGIAVELLSREKYAELSRNARDLAKQEFGYATTVQALQDLLVSDGSRR